MEELQHHERLDWADVNLEQKMIVNNTGCQLPCHYREYQVAGEPQGGPAPALLKRNIGDRWGLSDSTGVLEITNLTRKST